MIGIVDSSPLIVFAAIRRLDLIPQSFDEVIVPDAVWDEVVVQGPGKTVALDPSTLNWARRAQPAIPADLNPALVGLGKGEADAIALALAYDGPVTVIIDDSQARAATDRLGLRRTGSAGVLITAKSQGLILEVGPWLSALRGAGLYLDDETARLILRIAGETPS